MDKKKSEKGYTNRVQAHFQKELPEGNYEPAFRRWLVRQINEGDITRAEAIRRFNFNPQQGWSMLCKWISSYSCSEELPLPAMTAEEKAENRATSSPIMQAISPQ
jgi:transposase-like protein